MCLVIAAGDDGGLLVQVWRNAMELIFEQRETLRHFHRHGVDAAGQGIEAGQKSYSRRGLCDSA